MSDEEIKKALECCISPLSCRDGCPLYNNIYCKQILMTKALDLINRQQAEIKQAKSEAIKEFAERLKGAKKYSVERHENIVPVAVIDWVVQEMVGGENAWKGGEPVCDYTKTDWNDCCECPAKDHCDTYNERSEVIGDLIGSVIDEIKNEGR